MSNKKANKTAGDFILIIHITIIIIKQLDRRRSLLQQYQRNTTRAFNEMFHRRQFYITDNCNIARGRRYRVRWCGDSLVRDFVAKEIRNDGDNDDDDSE